MEDWEHYVEVVEIAVHKMPQEVHIGELEKYRFGFKYGDQPLEMKVSDRQRFTKSMESHQGWSKTPPCIYVHDLWEELRLFHQRRDW